MALWEASTCEHIEENIYSFLLVVIHGRGAVCQALFWVLRTGTVSDGGGDDKDTIQMAYRIKAERPSPSTCILPTSPGLLKS